MECTATRAVMWHVVKSRQHCSTLVVCARSECASAHEFASRHCVASCSARNLKTGQGQAQTSFTAGICRSAACAANVLMTGCSLGRTCSTAGARKREQQQRHTTPAAHFSSGARPCVWPGLRLSHAVRAACDKAAPTRAKYGFATPHPCTGNPHVSMRSARAGNTEGGEESTARSANEGCATCHSVSAAYMFERRLAAS